MRRIVKLILTLLDLYQKFGWKIFYSFIFKVFWTQDTKMKNDGFDILSIDFPKDGYYYVGTYQQREKFIKSITWYIGEEKNEKSNRHGETSNQIMVG
jgi:hypothetical protein